MLQIFLAECVLEHQPDGGFHTEDAIFIVTLKQVEDISAAIALWCANRSMLLSLLGPAYTYPQWLAMRGYDDGIAKLAAIAMESQEGTVQLAMKRKQLEGYRSGLASKKWRGFYCLGGYFDETAAIYTRV
jgi:hypothetical protein